MDHGFDKFAKALAGTVPRREALRFIAGGFAATLVAPFALGKARAHDDPQPNHGNDTCAHFCNEVYPPGDERGHCKSDAAHCNKQVRETGDPDVCDDESICHECDADPSRFCENAAGDFCCPDTGHALLSDSRSLLSGYREHAMLRCGRLLRSEQ